MQGNCWKEERVMGRVYFIGAGPYDSSLLTTQGLQILKNADCVLYDHLLDEELLSHTKGECIYVGKQAGHHSLPQEEINALLMQCAKRYEHVVRLKGGDSFVFGRGGEEGLALAKEGIPFTFVPGISSAIAALEMAGIPITHRGLADGFQVLSAHSQHHRLQIAAKQVENPSITTVFLMGLSRIKEICALLREAQRSGSTKLAVIMQGCRPTQQVICATLDTIEEKMQGVVLQFPGIVVVGEVVGLREQLFFYEKKPLFGRRILITKVQKETSLLTTLCKEQGAMVKEVQTGEIQYIEQSDIPAKLARCGSILFTSRHGVHGFFQSLYAHGDMRMLAGKDIYVIADKTAKALQNYGIKADHIAKGNTEALLALLEEEEVTRPILYSKGAQAASLQTNKPIDIIECIVYAQRAVTQEDIQLEEYDAICFSCASSVARFPLPIKEHLCISIGPATTKALQRANAKHIQEAESPSYEAMLTCLLHEEERSCIEEED